MAAEVLVSMMYYGVLCLVLEDFYRSSRFDMCGPLGCLELVKRWVKGAYSSTPHILKKHLNVTSVT